jgi:hypothetical protein
VKGTRVISFSVEFWILNRTNLNIQFRENSIGLQSNNQIFTASKRKKEIRKYKNKK